MANYIHWRQSHDQTLRATQTNALSHLTSAHLARLLHAYFPPVIRNPRTYVPLTTNYLCGAPRRDYGR